MTMLADYVHVELAYLDNGSTGAESLDLIYYQHIPKPSLCSDMLNHFSSTQSYDTLLCNPANLQPQGMVILMPELKYLGKCLVWQLFIHHLEKHVAHVMMPDLASQEVAE